MTEIKHNRFREEIFVQNFSVDLVIHVEKFPGNEEGWKAWLAENPRIWETGKTAAQAIGYLVISLESHDIPVKVNAKV